MEGKLSINISYQTRNRLAVTTGVRNGVSASFNFMDILFSRETAKQELVKATTGETF